MSIECSECERDARAGHAPDCSRRVAVEFQVTTDGTIEAIYDGAEIAAIEPGSHDGQNNFHSDLPGFTISYGRGFGKSKWFATLEAAKTWVERKAEDLRDY